MTRRGKNEAEVLSCWDVERKLGVGVESCTLDTQTRVGLGGKKLRRSYERQSNNSLPALHPFS